MIKGILIAVGVLGAAVFTLFVWLVARRRAMLAEKWDMITLLKKIGR